MEESKEEQSFYTDLWFWFYFNLKKGEYDQMIKNQINEDAEIDSDAGTMYGSYDTVYDDNMLKISIAEQRHKGSGQQGTSGKRNNRKEKGETSQSHNEETYPLPPPPPGTGRNY